MIDHDESAERFIFTTTGLVKVKQFLDEHQGLDPREYKDTKGNNIVHHLCYHGEKQLLKLYIAHTKQLLARRREQEEKLYQKSPLNFIKEWVNQKNIQGFTPLLYAGFNGDIEMLKYLIELGADIYATNNTKLNVLIMAAQSNRVSTFIFFKDKIDINLSDEKNSTALHWAAYNGSEEVVTYLLTYKDIKINIRDDEGQTPIFVATVYGNTRIVRRLLMKGANRHVKNNEGKKPMDIARENEFPNIIKMLNDEYSCLDFFKFYYNVKLDYRPKDRSLVMPIVFVLSTFCCLLIVHGLVEIKQDWMFVIEVVLLVLMIVTYLSLLRKPPQEPQGNIQTFMGNPRKICVQCVRRKPKRSYHCEICKTCIEQYDHHCTWINNCVGKHNIARFIFFVFLLVLVLAALGTISGLSFWFMLAEQEQQLQQFFVLRENHDRQSSLWYAQVVLLGISGVMCLFFFPVLMLLCVQVKNLFINKTTYQRIKGTQSTVKERLKGKKKVSLKNCRTMCGETKQSFSSSASYSDLEEDLFQR